VKYPNWSQDKYACVKSDLSGVFAVHEITQIDARLRRIAALKPGSVSALKERVQSLLNISRHDVDKSVLRPLAEELEKMPQSETANNNPRIARMREVLLSMYMNIPMKTFSADFDRQFADRINSKNSETEEEKELTMRRNALWSEDVVPSYFRGDRIPEEWGSVRVGFRGSRDINDCMVIFRQFITDYKFRSSLFAVPVTINGVAITSLEPKYMEVWRGLYGLLGISKIPKRVMYTPIILDTAAVLPPEVRKDDAPADIWKAPPGRREGPLPTTTLNQPPDPDVN
jgi:hypothetical protein